MFLVEDDEAVRDAVAVALRTVGIRVTTFSSARECLEAWRAGRQACLVVDLDSPELEPGLLRLLAEPAPALSIIATSRRWHRRRPALIDLRVPLLEKPFGMEELLPLIRGAFGLTDPGGSGT